MEIKEECVEVLNTSKIVCEENKRKIVFNNLSNSNISKIKVDGCQITEGIRCDYLITFNNDEHFVELKGKDVTHAFKQLIRTINLLKNSSCTNRVSYVISSRSPLTSPEIQVQRLKFIKKYQSKLIVKNSNYQVSI